MDGLSVARKALMSWEGHPYYRWVKMYRGVRYRIACADLGIPRPNWTKEATYQAANAWWLRKRGELESRPAEHPHQDALADLARKLEYAERHGLEEEATVLRGRVAEVQQLAADDTPADPVTTARVEAARVLGADIPTDFDPTATNILFGDERLWDARFRSEAAVPAERTIGGLAGKWTAMKAEEAVAGVRSADGADNIRIALTHFTTFAGTSNPVDAIDADLWDRWHVRCQAQVAKRDDDPRDGWSADYASKVFGISRAFVTWLWEREILASLPRNLNSKKYRFERPDKIIPTFTDTEIKLLLDKATGQLRLHLLLMLNCGMTQKDISDLKMKQITKDSNGNIVGIKRRRSKTEKKKHTPEVLYPLWPETARLLKEYLSDDPIFALLTHTQRRWVRKEMLPSGKLKKSDNIATNFQHLRRKAKLTGEGKSLKVFRKTSATRLKSNKAYRDLRFYFLGHSPRTIADRHYAAECEILMDEAVAWLGKQYGLTT